MLCTGLWESCRAVKRCLLLLLLLLLLLRAATAQLALAWLS
jgi:hypothetical protein